MTNPYTAPTLTSYNATPPSDDGANTAGNEVTWAGIKSKLSDPLKNFADAISSAVSTAFAALFLNAVGAHSADYTVVSSDRGKLLSCTNTITITLLAAGTAGEGFPLTVLNSGSGVVTVDGNASEQVLGADTVTLNPGDMLVIACDGSDWLGSISPSVNGDGDLTIAGTFSSIKAAASGFTRVSPNFCIANNPGETILSSGDTSIDAPSPNAIAVLIEAQCTVKTANSIANRSALLTFWTDSDKTLLQGGIQSLAREFIATTANTVLNFTSGRRTVLLASKGAAFTANLDVDAGGNSGAGYYIVGYYE